METEAKCTTECYNHKMIAHLGEEEAHKHDMLYEWDRLQGEYHKLWLMNPKHRIKEVIKSQKTEEEQERLINRVDNQSKLFKRNQFDFY